jgi:glycosyltransferase involved in cell wall biosynthesis
MSAGRQPVVSIVIPSFNKAQFLGLVLDSLLAQTFSDWEAIVVDNRSTDGTSAVLAGYADARIRVESVDNGGVIAVSRNAGIRLARGTYVAFLDADDWWTPEKLQRAVDALNAGADVFYHDMWVVEELSQTGFSKRVGARPVTVPVYQDLIRQGTAMANSSVVARADLLRVVGGLDESPELVAAEDFELWLRLARVTEKFHCEPACLGYYWQGGGTVSSAQRTITSLSYLATRHALESGPDGVAPIWFDYNLGRAAFQLGDARETRKRLTAVLGRQPVSMLGLKSAVTLIQALTRYVLSAGRRIS